MELSPVYIRSGVWIGMGTYCFPPLQLDKGFPEGSIDGVPPKVFLPKDVKLNSPLGCPVQMILFGCFSWRQGWEHQQSYWGMVRTL